MLSGRGGPLCKIIHTRNGICRCDYYGFVAGFISIKYYLHLVIERQSPTTLITQYSVKTIFAINFRTEMKTQCSEGDQNI